MWNDFNHGWLGLLQKQCDVMESGQKPQAGQSVIPRDELEDMGKELVRLCDGVEKHGLVDYEYGVWEEQIVGSKSCGDGLHVLKGMVLLTWWATVLTDCLDFYESDDESGPSGRST
ncbi:hypothetical protein IMZ48_36630 [Candidatus Bathyarchaeota archaeon]|nr:hypothetical protein [Candidatus Bathyarchaeota archaeon]